MKGWGQILNLAARDMLAELRRVAPTSPITHRAAAVIEMADAIGAKASGRPPSEPATARRVQTVERIEKRDRECAEAARLYQSGLGLVEVAAAIRRSTSFVVAALQQQGIPTRPKGGHPHPHDKERIKRIRTMRREGKTLQEIGAAEHISRERVRQICARAGISTKLNLELSDSQKAAVAEYVGGASLNQVSCSYGVGTAAVRSWVIRSGYVPRSEAKQRNPETIQKAQRAADLYRAGYKATAIARQIGFRKPSTIYRLLAIAGVKPDRKPPARHGLR